MRAWVGAALLLAGCSVGEGQGQVQSERLRAEGCLDGPYSLNPNFFSSNPFRNTQTLRLQRTDDIIDNSDGVQILVSDTELVRGKLGQPMKVGLPPEVTPPGVPVVEDPDPPRVQVTIYLHETCHGQNIALPAVQGQITFKHLFSGKSTEDSADDRLSEANFDVEVEDPRFEAEPGGQPRRSRLTGWFRFYFERGQPAQPFPLRLRGEKACRHVETRERAL